MSLLTSLRVYSKPHGVGDQTSGGRGKLLRATSDLTRVDVLVRETLQNSWDARVPGWVPAYGVDLHQPDDAARRVLRERVFSEIPASLDVLRSSLADPGMRVMEIFDRGTSGLDGPYHANRAAEEGEPNNFNSFVFDIGTTKVERDSGGTFGFGKTATFEVSHAHAVVYWSVCETKDGSLEHRLIAASNHEPYVEDGARYTGAHWWGVFEDGVITPLRGDAAQELGEMLFQTHFGDEETGTSILVIDPEVRLGSNDDTAAERVPVRSSDHENLLVDTVVDALAVSAWPKAISKGDEFPPMIFHVYKNGEEIEVTEKIGEVYKTFGSSLTAVRDHLGQLDGPVQRPALAVIKEDLFPITLRPRYSGSETKADYFGKRTDSLAGVLHLMITADLERGDDPGGDGSLARPEYNRLCFMRSKTELVVFYEDVANVDLSQVSWTGVFKPTPECDFHFASAEPPTHDAWTPNTADTEVSSYVVRQSLAAIKRKTREFLEAQQIEHKAANRSVRDVANALSGFVPLGASPAPAESPSRSSRSSRRTRARSGPEVVVTDHSVHADGRRYLVNFSIDGSEGQLLHVTVRPSARTAEGQLRLDPDECSIEWIDSVETSADDRTAVFRGGDAGQLKIQTKALVSLDLGFDVEVMA